MKLKMDTERQRDSFDELDDGILRFSKSEVLIWGKGSEESRRVASEVDGHASHVRRIPIFFTSLLDLKESE